jgi:16S rRNA (guanine966-N2)-methyltransferase
VRIISGTYGGRTLKAPPGDATRPTSDRVREALFSILGARTSGAHVLDLFAGSGALGLEAVSRGAGSACLVERDPGLAARLREQVGKLGAAGQVEVVQEDALRWLARPPAARFDIAFVDPPFAAGLWNQVLAALPAQLSEQAWLYVEAPHDAAPALPAEWRPHREGTTREVRYALYQRRAAATLTPP